MFAYPKTKHKRKQNPPIFGNYKKYKPFLAIEFNRRCIYCHDISSLRPDDHAFAVEHYLPQSLYPTLINTYSNLYYACSRCNTYKKKFDPRSSKTETIPNPCDYVMYEHLQFVDSTIKAKTSIGIFSVKVLKLNHKERIEYRSFVLRNVERIKKELDIYASEISELKNKLKLYGLFKQKVLIALIKLKIKKRRESLKDLRRHVP